jgi:hypothetical protein
LFDQLAPSLPNNGKPFVSVYQCLSAPNWIADEGRQRFLEPVACGMVPQDVDQLSAEVECEAVQWIDRRVGLLVQFLISFDVTRVDFGACAHTVRGVLVLDIAAVLQRGSSRPIRVVRPPHVQESNGLASLCSDNQLLLDWVGCKREPTSTVDVRDCRL